MASAVIDTHDVAQPRRRARLQEPVSPPAVPANRLGRASSGNISRRESSGAMVAQLPGGRLHLQHGPIDIVAEAFGEPSAVRASYARAARRFATVLEELVAELSALRSPDQPVNGGIARSMARAVAPFRPVFITPMAAVAGAVANEIVAAMAGPGIARAYANNGGDIALFLTQGQVMTCALAVTGGMDRVRVRAKDAVHGIATSGWRGRSFSLGIADAVTVLAPSAAMADAAATMIANAVDCPGHPGIRRLPARDIRCDSDLGAMLVTVDVPQLTPDDRSKALEAGLDAANGFLARGLIAGAALFLQGEARMTGTMLLPEGGKRD